MRSAPLSCLAAAAAVVSAPFPIPFQVLLGLLGRVFFETRSYLDQHLLPLKQTNGWCSCTH